MEKEIKVLYVDDDVDNLNVFKASFRNDYYVFIAASAEGGMDILKDNDINVVIADQRMPGMTGVEFFEQILKQFPDPIRILLTGYSDIESVIEAINKGQVYRYINKPWNEQELKVAIDNAYEIYTVRQELLKSNKELKKRNDELNRFVYSASHELKAPLMTILGILKMAEQNKDTEPRQYLSMIEKCTKNLQIFIRNIVDYYKNQKYEEYKKEIDFEKIIKELIENYLFYENISDINFSISVNQKEVFITDEFRIKVIINNLLSNSIKYQDKESVEKKVSVSVNIENQCATLIIEDNGIGIEKKYLDNIFNMFFRATDHSPGSGIGLYIAKEAVQHIGGEINVESQEGKGTKFIVKIPGSGR